MKWTLIGEFPKVNKCIVIVVPHTSWVDFFLGILIIHNRKKDKL